MRTKILSILAVLALGATLPLAAQDPIEQPTSEPPAEAVPYGTEAEPMGVDEPLEPAEPAELGTEAESVAPTDVAEQEELPAEELPATASPLPLLALGGALSVAAGLALRLRRRK